MTRRLAVVLACCSTKATRCASRRRGMPLNILIIEQHPTGKGLSQASQKAQQGCLAGTVRAQQTQRLPLCHLEGHTIDHRLAADLPDQVLGRDADHVSLSSCGVLRFSSKASVIGRFMDS